MCVCSLCVNEMYFIDVSVSSCTNSLCVPMHHIEEYMMELFNSVIQCDFGFGWSLSVLELCCAF